MTTATAARCPRCGGTMLDDWGEGDCLACGYRDPGRTPEETAALVRELGSRGRPGRPAFDRRR